MNGAPDWVNEEELGLHDCFRWSPDSSRIAFWPFDTHGVGVYQPENDFGEFRRIPTSVPFGNPVPYPTTTGVPYPVAGTTNSRVRVGVAKVHRRAVVLELTNSSGGVISYLPRILAGTRAR